MSAVSGLTAKQAWTAAEIKEAWLTIARLDAADLNHWENRERLAAMVDDREATIARMRTGRP